MTPTQRQDAGRLLGQAQDELRDRLGGVSANDLANPVSRVTVPQPTQAEPVGVSPELRGIVNQTGQFIQAQSEEANRLRELRQEQASLSNEGSLQDLFTSQQAEMGVPQNLRDLQDIQMQIADLSTESLQNRSDIARAQGQTVGQGSREISAEQARNNVRSYGLGARAAILQGNIETASRLASQAVQFAYQDRSMRNTNLINQINSLQGVVDNQTAQLLEKDRRVYEEDQAKIQRVQETVDAALQSGAAGSSEIAFLTDPRTSDEERLAMGQLIRARSAGEFRDIQMQTARIDLAKKSQELARLRNPVVATRDTSVIDVGGEKQLVDTQTGEVIATFGADVSTDEIERARDTNFVNTLDGLKTHPGLNTSVGPVGLARVGIVDAFGNKDDFIGSIENVVRTLTLNTFAEAKEKGMTFGAMSQGEWDILSQSATKIAQWREYEKDGIPLVNRKTTDQVVGYDISEEKLLRELDVLSNFAKMDALRKGVAPADIGVIQTDDGKYWTQNSDGSMAELLITPR